MRIYHQTLSEGEDLVLLHGWAFNSEIWRPLVAWLQGRFRVHLIDLPGFGRSRDAEFDPDLSQNIFRLLPYLPQKAHYVGWSLGGLLAQQLALAFPEKVSSLLLVSSTPCFLSQAGWQGVTTDYFADFYRQVAHHPEKALQQFVLFGLAGRQQQKQHRVDLFELLFRFGIPQRKSLLAGLEVLKNTDLRQAIAQIACPVHFCHGRHDPLTPTNHGFDSSVIDGAGHFPLFTHVDVLSDLLNQLIHEYQAA